MQLSNFRSTGLRKWGHFFFKGGKNYPAEMFFLEEEVQGQRCQQELKQKINK